MKYSDGLFHYCLPTEEKCPCGAHPLPDDGSSLERDIQVRPEMAVLRNGLWVSIEAVKVVIRCILRYCPCGIGIAYVDGNDGRKGYAFKCRLCDTFAPSLAKNGRCLTCILSREMKVNNPTHLYDSLAEADGTLMGPAQTARFDAFLRSVIRGDRGSVVPDP